ncbi:MAG: hypothetical protein PHU07_05555 [Acidocella sp.]|nr:hypothetical protein [Acidocella sp.]
MATETRPNLPETVDFDASSKHGWEVFTKFLFGNAAAAILLLVLIAALTVWR